ncbi:MAG TPA: VOC family protein [Reyranella sp.]|nr:VOC family protein [Reyranella sp.]
MSPPFKPSGYNAVSPYLVVTGAQRMIDFLKIAFGAKELRRYDNGDGTIMHAEVKIDDSVVMMGDASAAFPANKLLIHVYVADVDAVFAKALAAGATVDQQPQHKPGDPERRGSFKDFAGNIWSVATQQ